MEETIMENQLVKIYARTIESEAIQQVNNMANSRAYKGCKMRIMPDCHAGANSTVGTVIEVAGRIIPNTVGVDIGCGMSVYDLSTERPDLADIDRIIHERVPSGPNIHETAPTLFQPLEELVCRDGIDIDNAQRSIGTLGGGNHFIEINTTQEGHYYLVIHSGSRKLGLQVCKYYQAIAERSAGEYSMLSHELIARYKAEGRDTEIAEALKILRTEHYMPNGEEYLAGAHLEDYLHDMAIVQQYAALNRHMIARAIIGERAEHCDHFDTIHNYIEVERGILRKGAVRAECGERLIIPINMREGSLICIGKGNDDWLRSAPHGAGRLMSRSKAKQTLSMEEFLQTMEGIYTTSICEETLDEAPMVYKPIEEIMECIEPTAEVVDIIRPIYNYKAHN